ncbi:MAG TPA: LysM domain-containing protein [Ottowia sp.]|nr:LysM domain-containing protein [Ottowia sp.]
MKLLFPGATRALVAPLGLLTAALLGAPPAAAQAASRLPVTPMQRATAQQVAAQGVPLSALAPDAPDQYTVRRGDTLWRISSLFLKSPWRWPELWGMNLQDIRNPHLIYPGQQLYLERLGDRAFLRARRGADGEVGDTVRVSPRNRIEMLGTGPLPTLEPHLIEPFLTEPLVVDDDSFQRAPRIVALANQSRVLVAKGDRAYVRGPADAPLLKQAGDPTEFRVFRNAKPLKDPVTGETLGYEGHYVGQATLVRGESEAEEDAGAAPAVRPTRWPANGEVQSEPRRAAAPQPRALPVPATVDVISSKEEMRAGDRLLPEPPREYRNYVPRVPEVPVDARVVAVPGSAVRYAGQNQVVVINKGLQDGIESGHVLALLSTGPKLVDKTDEARGLMKLPDERNGIAMVFRPFERVSYVLVMEITNPVQVGDKLVNPN